MVVTKLKYIIPSILLFILTSCASLDIISQEMNGSYVQKENQNIELILSKGYFLFVDKLKKEHQPTYKCCDTIAYGKWNIDKKISLIELNSLDNINSSSIGMDIVEEEKPSLDSLSIRISNPIEKHYKNFEEKYREMFYSVTVITKDDYLVKTSDNNPILMEKVNGLKTLEITIYPKYDIPIREVSVREVHTIPYEIKNPSANVFEVNLPQLDYSYLSYRRLKGDFIKIINKNTLLWDGKEYIKR